MVDATALSAYGGVCQRQPSQPAGPGREPATARPSRRARAGLRLRRSAYRGRRPFIAGPARWIDGQVIYANGGVF
ncbi:hypothetical protein [Streptomyces sp. HPF1205]|uniref:hypothetical protein n=1 Tax=Streptomyces sp. HPF1205 TaxID=2873262 RepID=UPI001CEC3739|nr:hypothetical protein [Streptomyces sp. HPF1205]